MKGDTLFKTFDPILEVFAKHYRPTQRAPDGWDSARFLAFSWLSVFSVLTASSPSHLPPLTQTVDCNNMCYMSKPSENAKFSRIFDDSSLQKV